MKRNLEDVKLHEHGSNREVVPEWDYEVFTGNLLTVSKNGECCWSLSPSNEFIKDLSRYSGAVPDINLKVELQRPLNYDPKVGWFWHKSWNIPNITLTLEIKNKGQDVRVATPISVQVFAVKESFEDNQTTLHDLGLKGVSCHNLRNGSAHISGLKFLTTSYYHKGTPFRLLFSAFQRNHANPDMPIFITSVLSPAFLIDSRRLARDTIVCKEKLLRSTKEYFPVEVIGTTFYKRQSNKSHVEEIKIDSKFDGLHHYFTARNIRCKIRHPVFLALKFSECVKLYYNTEAVPSNNVNDILLKLQLTLDEMDEKSTESPISLDSSGKLGPFKPPSFLLFINCPKDRVADCGRVVEAIGLKGSKCPVQTITDPSMLTSTFRSVDDIEALKVAAGELFRQPSISSASIASVGPGSNNTKFEDGDRSLSIASAPPRIGQNRSQSEDEGSDFEQDRSYRKLPPINLFFPIKKRPVPLHPLPTYLPQVMVPHQLLGKKRPLMTLPPPRLPQKEFSEEAKQQSEDSGCSVEESTEALRQALFKKSKI